MSIAGWVLQAGAVGGLAAGAVVASGDNPNHNVTTGILLGALTVSLIGDLVWLAGNTHSLNAINIYNDGVSPTP